MSYKIKKTELKQFLIYTCVIFVIISITYLGITLFIQTKENNIQKTTLLSSEDSMVHVEREILSNKINRLISDLLYISDSLKISDANDDDYEKVSQHWLAFANRKKIYDQIRFIDFNGDEKIRVNYCDNSAVLVDEEYLQNKQDRYYFTDTISLKETQIYLSQLDLNVEHDEIEQPIKPMIRLSIPYYGEDGAIKGIVILNYLANDILLQIKNISSISTGSIFMLNSDGYWLFNSEDSNKEWTFMYEDQLNISFANQYPDEWQEIKTNGSGVIISENGIFNYTNLLTNKELKLDDEFSLVSGAGDLYIISFISPNTQSGQLFNNNILENSLFLIKERRLVYLLILILAFILSIFIVNSKIKKERIKYFSEFDTMTGIYNRRAGYDKLQELYQSNFKQNNKITICFIDINGLKEVNDLLGHEAGDELIISVINGIKKHTRENDFVVRLGGDEFLIVFSGLETETAEMIWTRIVSEYENINSNENRKYLVSVSHGIETINPNETIDSAINLADEKMYIEKKQIKKGLKIIKQ